MNLWEYTGKKVCITFDDGQVLRGRVDFYTSALDNPEGKASISLKDTTITDGYVEVMEDDEIKDIQIIE